MSSLLPSHAANHVLDGLSEYLTTSFSLAEHTTASALEKFLKDPHEGMFHGPYIRTRLPYAPATQWEGVLEWLPENFVPYRHQAQAFSRLSSLRDGHPARPEPTLVVTGTGSGKTEAFLYPILDHCRRQHLSGHYEGVKALILYPMNALANDQAARLAKLISTDPELSGIRAGIYTGEDQGNRTKVSNDGLITDRETMRQSPPDILLTNYKMLDQLLLRDADANIWKKSAATLQYVALDEFHTYDGAQGTDVALLLRRMGLRLKKHQSEGFLTETEASRPLGRITPVATSATLGSGDKASAEILDFAHTIFGEVLSPDAIIRETTLEMAQWQDTISTFTGIAATPTGTPSRDEVEIINRRIAEMVAGGDANYDAAVHTVFCDQVFGCSEDLEAAVAAASQSELVVNILSASAKPILFSGGTTDTLVSKVLAPEVQRLPEDGAAEFLSHALAEIAHLRASFGARFGWDGKKFPGVETHLWVREVSRVDRRVGLTDASEPDAEAAVFRWADSGVRASDTDAWLPACYCRNCGRSGWMTAMDAGQEQIELGGRKIRQQSISRRERMRPLLDASSEVISGTFRSNDDSASVFWLNAAAGQLLASAPSEEEMETGGVVPVLTYSGAHSDELARKQACPSCGENDAIRFLGSSIATLLSVAISNLFGMGDLDSAEKKSLVFVDSVQDAAHRAGFVQSRARTFAIRTRTRQMVGDTPLRLSELPEKLINSTATDPLPGRARFELLPPWVAENHRFRGFWDDQASKAERESATRMLRDVLELDLALEFGDRSDLPRSLVSTGALSVAVEVSDTELREAVAELGMLDASSVDWGGRELPWARGVLEYMRQAGGIQTALLKSFLKHDGNAYLLNRRQASALGVPKFAPGRAPTFPRIGKKVANEGKFGKDHAVTPISSARSSYARWTAAMLGISTSDAAQVVTDFFAECARRGIVNAVPTDSGGTIYALSPERIVLAPEGADEILECTVCRRRLALDTHGRALLDGARCISTGCEGSFAIVGNPDNYYRRLYHSHNSRTVVAKEHTGLLDSAERVALENEFKKPVPDQDADAPNVLVATPTLEMGIDIGDLSTVMLASLPNTVASYVQRVGRAGRLTGNSLVLAMVVGRHKALARLNDPVETIGGEVQPPAAFLSAREIVHRQFAAYLIDSIDFATTGVELRQASSVFGTSGRNLVAELVERLEAGVDPLVEEFAATIEGHTRPGVIEELRSWVREDFAAQLRKAEQDWRAARQVLIERRKVLRTLFDELQQESESSRADDETEEKLRRTRAAFKYTTSQLNKAFDHEYWIAALERYGILPNFTLLDDSVEFSVSVTRADATTGEFDTEAREYARGVSSALFELAPGATFYAQGIAATVDSVDLGPQNSALEKWRICPSCSYSEVYPAADKLSATGPCPQCGNSKFGDISQVINVVQMRKVSASVDYSRSAISDRFDERRTTRFERALSMVVPGETGPGWYLSGTGFGIQYLPTVEMRWLNLGKPVGETGREYGGVSAAGNFFRVCRECGHVDSKAGENNWRDHKPWCSLRHARQEDTIEFALGRRLTTQGVLMHLPTEVSTTDISAVPSLIAALKMGFKEYLGGNPDHLDVVSVFTESDGSVHQQLLLHDTIPGGTGYLSQFTDPADIHRLLQQAYTKLDTCQCKSQALKACPHCLMPFTPAHEVEVVSRESALATLLKILLDDAHPTDTPEAIDSLSWKGRITDVKPQQSERSRLEEMFLEQLRADLTSLGAKVSESTRGTHAYWTIQFPGSNLRWTMEEQKKLPAHLGATTIPDFFFEVDGAELDRIAVYLDGRHYHASSTHNRVAEDITRRNVLYADGIIPWSLTISDIHSRKQVADGANLQPPRWFNDSLRHYLNTQLNLEDSLHQLLLTDPMTQLLSILQRPTQQWATLSRAAGSHAALHASQAPNTFGPLMSFGLKDNSFALTFKVHDGEPNAGAWNRFLNLANLLYLDAYHGGRNEITVEAVATEEGAAGGAAGDMAASGAAGDMAASGAAGDMAASGAGAAIGGLAQDSAVEGAMEETLASSVWAQALEEFADEEPEVTAALKVLLGAHALEPSHIGAEVEGRPTVVSWSNQQVALVYPGEAADFDDATKPGWTILDSATVTAANIPDSLLPPADS